MFVESGEKVRLVIFQFKAAVLGGMFVAERSDSNSAEMLYPRGCTGEQSYLCH